MIPGWLPSVLLALAMALFAIIYWLCQRGEAANGIRTTLDTDSIAHIFMFTRSGRLNPLSPLWQDLPLGRVFFYATSGVRMTFRRWLRMFVGGECEAADSSSEVLDPSIV